MSYVPDPIEDLRISEIRYRRLFESARDGILILDAVTRKITDVNPFMVELLGYTREEFLGKELWEIGLLKDEEESIAAFKELQEKTYIRYNDMPLKTNDGERREVEFISNVYTENGHQVIQCNIRDISKRVRTQASLRLSETNLADAQRIAHIGSWDWDIQNNQFIWSDEIYRIFGLTKTQFEGTYEGFIRAIHPEDRQSVQSAVDAALSQIAPYNIEHRVVHSDGVEKIVCEIGEVKFDVSGKPLQFSGTVQDITERKRQELSLIKLTNQIEREARVFNTTLSAIADFAYIFDCDGRFVYANQALLNLLGLRLDEVVGKNFLDLSYPDELAAQLQQQIQQVFDTQQKLRGERPYTSPTSKSGYYEYIFSPVFADDGTVELVAGSTRDITERKQAEEEKMLLAVQIEQQHERLSNIIDNVAGVAWEAWGMPDAPTQRIDFISDYVETMLGYTVEEWLGTPNFWLSIVHPEDRERMARVASENFLKSQSFTEEFRWVAKDGRSVWVETHSTIICDKAGQPIGYRGVTIDITERKLAERLIKESEERYRFLFKNNPLPMWAFDFETFAFLSVNDAAITHYGYTREEFLAMTVKDIRPPEDVPVFLENVAKDIPGIRNAGVLRHIKKDGTVIDVEITTNQLIFNGKNAKLVLANDVTERKLADRKIRESEERYRIVAETANDVIITINEHSSILFVNSAMEKTLGYKPEELIGENLSIIVPERFRAAHDAGMRRYMQTGERRIPWSSVEFPALHRDGREVQVEISFGEYQENDKRLFTAIIRDITERKGAEEILRESEERFRSIVETTTEWIWAMDSQGNSTYSNPAIETILGYTPEELVGKSFLPFMYEEDGDKVEQLLPTLIAEKRGWINLVNRWYHKDGSIRDLESNAVPFLDSSGEVIGYRGADRDITERKRAEQSILESEEKYRNIVETANEGILLNDIEGRTVFVNRQMPEMLGYTADDLLGRTIFDFIFEEDFAVTKQKIERRKQGKVETGELRLRRKDGSEIICLHKSSPTRNKAGEITGFLTMNTDITERKKAEDSIRFQAHLLDVVEQAIVATDLDGIVIYWNQFARKLYGWSAVEAVGRNITELTAPDISKEEAVKIIAQLRAGKSWSGEFLVQNKNGITFPSYGSSSSVNDDKGTLTGIVAISIDITERKLREEALRKAEAQYRNLVESSPVIVYLAEPSPPFAPIYVSPNVTSFGYTIEEWFNRPDMWISLIHEEDRERVLRATEAAMQRGHDTNLEYRVICRDGTICWLHDRGRFVTDDQGEQVGWQGVMLDITENKELEEHLRQSQKLESIGQLVGGIAHDFNNMLTVINGYSELTLRNLESESPLRHNIEEIKKAGERAALLTHQLLAFSRRQVLQPVVLDLNEIITDTSKMLERMIGEDVELVIALEPETGLVNVDPGQLSQIIMNLAVNARDAMPQGGRLTIETANIFLEPDEARQKVDILPGAYVMLAVCDTGDGIDDKILQHIFEPFFTTKNIGKGTGLGLSTVYGIVKQSGGNIEVDSKVGAGTTFRIYLPRVAEQSEAAEIKDTSAELPSGTETILLVEDEELVRNLSREILETCGYTVIEARNGLEALKVCENGDCKIDLLMTDVVMPQMGGRELAEKLSKKLPNLKILFTSGYINEGMVRNGVIETSTNFIQKPFTFDTLARKVRELLDA